MLRFITILTILCVTIISTHAEAEKDSDNATDVSSISALPLKSIRYRRQHPTVKKIVKHLIRTTKRTKPRRRIKRPKIKYGPPNYGFGEPILRYNPIYPQLPDDVGVGVEESGGETIYPSFEHFNQLSFDSADFELPPCSYETQSMDLDFYSTAHSNNYNQYAVDLPTFPEPRFKHKRKPHRKYGAPYKRGHPQESLETLRTLEEDFNEPYTYKKRGSYYARAPSYEALHPPATNYGVPVRNCKPESIPPHNYISHTPAVLPAYHTPSFDQNQYALYDKKIRNSGYYAADAKHKEPAPTDVHLKYSPTYDLDLDNSYDSSYDGDFGEPPADIAYEHAPPSNLETHQEPSESEDSRIFAQPSHELPLNNHVRPSYNFPKTSYEVPIYDPVPFEGPQTDVRQEQYPPIVELPILPTPRTTRLRSRHRKRVSSSPSKSTTRHILHTPDFEESFEVEQENEAALYGGDADTNESTIVEQAHFAPTVPPVVHKSRWDPMRVRSESNFIKHFLPTTIPTEIEQNTTTTTTTKQQRNNRRTVPRRATSLSTISLSKRRQPINNTQSTQFAQLMPHRFYTPSPQQQQQEGSSTTKRTTNSVFDTTLFKSPRNTYNSSYINNELRNIFKNSTSEQFIGILPPNHKYF